MENSDLEDLQPFDFELALQFLTSLDERIPPESTDIPATAVEDTQSVITVQERFHVVTVSRVLNTTEGQLLRQELLHGRCFLSSSKHRIYLFSWPGTARGNKHTGKVSSTEVAKRKPLWRVMVGTSVGTMRSPISGTRSAPSSRRNLKQHVTLISQRISALMDSRFANKSQQQLIQTRQGNAAVWRLTTGGNRTMARNKRRRKAGNGISYSELLVPTHESADTTLGKLPITYDPFFLVNTKFRQGRRRTVMGLQGLTISVIPFVNPKKSKEELNDQFHELHPWIHPSLTQSKIRNLKADLFSVLTQVPELDVSTVASAWVYFERLVFKMVVEKTNRKLYGFACLLLAYKFNQATHAGVLKELVQALQKLDKKENLSSRDMFVAEFHVFMLLGFSLQLKLQQVLPHILEYLSTKDLSFEEMYGSSQDTFIALYSGLG